VNLTPIQASTIPHLLAGGDLLGIAHRGIRRIVAALPVRRQSALFSATMPSDVRCLADSALRDPLRAHIARTTPSRTADRATGAFRRSLGQVP
jgi:superfamily II DNA/RNA helicase